MDAFAEGSLLAFLCEVPDPRSRHGRQHALAAVLGLTCCAILCGARGYTAIAQWAADQDIALMHRLGFTRRPPKMGGIRKVLLALDMAALEAALTRWVESLLGRSLGDEPSPPEPFALDGKTARGSSDGLQKAVHLLSLVAHESGLTLAQMAVPDGVADKTNEHKASLRLLKALALEGRLVTGDAMFCQRDVSAEVINRGGHYLFFVKENQPTLLQDIEAAFAPSTDGAFSPSAAGDLAGRDGPGDDPGQGARPARATDAARDHRVDRIPGLAGGRSGRPDRVGGHAGREDLNRGPVFRHERASRGRGRRGVAPLGPGPLVDRESVASRTRRDVRRGREPDP